MITNFKINNYDILKDSRAVTQISGLSPTESVPATATAAGNKQITSTVRSNRTIQLTGYVAYDVEGFCNDVYSNWIIGETLNIEVISNNTTYNEKCIIKEIYIDRYMKLVPFTINIICYTPFLYCKTKTYTADEYKYIFDLDKCDMPQHKIKITHTIQPGETSLTIDFYGKTIIEYDENYDGKILKIDCEEQTCFIGNENKFYLVEDWQDGLTTETATIPPYTTIKYNKSVRGVW